MRGLVSYEDDSHSDSEDVKQEPSTKGKRKLDDDASRLGADAVSGSHTFASSSKPQIIIKRPAHFRNHLRGLARNEEPLPNNNTAPSSSSTPESIQHEQDSGEIQDESVKIRALLRPPSVTGVADWGIPPEPTSECDPDVKAKILQFHTLKNDPQTPRHFNDSLMSNRSFRNPHLYAKLVEFVDVDERTSNFPKSIWDPYDVKDEWYADRIAEFQKARSEQQTQNQNTGKRTRLEFTSAKQDSSKSSSSNDHRQKVNTADQRNRYQFHGFGGGRDKKSRWG